MSRLSLHVTCVMNVHFLERSISPLYPRGIDRANTSDEIPSTHGMRHARETRAYESPSRARPRGSILPVNLDDAHFSLKCGSSTKRNEKVRPDGSWEDKQDHRSSFLYLENSQSKQTTESIPISKDSMMRTSSELQLEEDEAIAEYRDQCMYVRILNGMSEQNQAWNGDTIDTIRHIMETRHEPVDQHIYPSSYVHDSRIRHSVINPLSSSPAGWRKKIRTIDPMQESLREVWPAQARLAPLTDDPVSSLYNAVDLDLSARLSLLVAPSVGDVSPKADGVPTSTSASEGMPTPLPLYVSFQEACPIDVDEDALFEMDDM